MDYTDLVQAIRENNSSRVDELLETLLPRLVRFMQIHMNASLPDAEDCAQESLLLCLEKISEENLHSPERVFSYLMTTCKNAYLKMHKANREQVYEEIPRNHYHYPGQLISLLEKEKNQILRRCLDLLKKEYREFMEFWFRHPDSETEMVANHFGISVNNAWTRKHRILKRLNECYEKKSKS